MFKIKNLRNVASRTHNVETAAHITKKQAHTPSLASAQDIASHLCQKQGTLHGYIRRRKKSTRVTRHFITSFHHRGLFYMFTSINGRTAPSARSQNTGGLLREYCKHSAKAHTCSINIQYNDLQRRSPRLSNSLPSKHE